MKLGLCIPTWQGEDDLNASSSGLLASLPLFHRTLAIDSSSTDQTVHRLQEIGLDVKIIPKSTFNHGTTRQWAVEHLDDCDIIVFMTQDAILTAPESLLRLVEPFEDPAITIAYGRQLPRPGAGPIEAHARLFNYPATSRIKSLKSIPELGLRAAVVSNSFAAYRRSALLELGGFPATNFGEDTFVGARAILAGKKIAYVAQATVYHSHDYSLIQEFHRYHANGIFYAREKWILEKFGKAEGSGKKYLLSEFRHLMRESPMLVPVSVMKNVARYLGFRLGQISHPYQKIPAVSTAQKAIG